MCSDTSFLDCQNDFRFLKQEGKDDALFFLFIYFPLHPFDGGLEEERNQMLVSTFSPDVSQSIDVFIFLFVSDDDNRVSGLVQNEIGEQSSDSSVAVSERMEIFVKPMKTGR